MKSFVFGLAIICSFLVFFWQSWGWGEFLLYRLKSIIHLSVLNEEKILIWTLKMVRSFLEWYLWNSILWNDILCEILLIMLAAIIFLSQIFVLILWLKKILSYQELVSLKSLYHCCVVDCFNIQLDVKFYHLFWKFIGWNICCGYLLK